MKIKNLVVILTVIIPLIYSNSFSQTLKPGDGIKLSFYNIEDSIKGNYFIEENGNIQFPYIGSVSFINKDFNTAKTEIIEKYSKFYKNPEINIQPLIKVDILGEVGNPGVYYLNGYETITDLLSYAGGETSDSNIDDIFVIRNNTRMEIDLESFLNGKNNIHDIGIESGDKVYIPRNWLVGARNASIIVSGVAVLVTVASLFRK